MRLNPRRESKGSAVEQESNDTAQYLLESHADVIDDWFLAGAAFLNLVFVPDFTIRSERFVMELITTSCCADEVCFSLSPFSFFALLLSCDSTEGFQGERS